MERLLRKSVMVLMALALALGAWGRLPVAADSTYQTLPFSQDWTNTNLITTTDNWSGVPGIVGYLGDYTTATPTGVDPQTLLADYSGTAVDVIANQANPNTLTTGGVAEFEITDPVVALQGSGTADAPFLLIHINTTGYQNITVAYNVRDIDGSADNATQQVALHYRVGTSGDFTNVPAAYIADATTGPNEATLVTSINVTLPSAVNNQSQVQLRIMTTNAVGNDEWIGIDDIAISGTPLAVDLTDFSAVWDGDAVTVSWETAQELDNLGFNLYRGESAAGPWTRLNAELIPTQNPGAVFGATYTWLDENVTPGATYFYRLEDVDIYGVSTFHGPVSTAPVDPSAVALSAFGARGPAFGLPLALAALGLWGLARKRRS